MVLCMCAVTDLLLSFSVYNYFVCVHVGSSKSVCVFDF